VSEELRQNQKNRYQALWEFAHGAAEVRSTPPHLQIARSNLCNLKCVYCSDHREGNEIPRSKIEGETWEALLGLIPRSQSLAFHGVSEFMIDLEFFDILERCARAGADLSINTNASVCTPKHLNALVNFPGFLSINFSIDACTPETFLRIRGYDFWRIVGNIKKFMDAFESRRDRTHSTLSFVITKSNVKEMMSLVYLGKALNVSAIKYYRLHEYDGLDWTVKAKTGDLFTYVDECTGNFADEYNRELERTRRAAETLGLPMEIPAPYGTEKLSETAK
jgi:MoaA/NifB/PqqE/SkfB family radical SAM enzyme